MARDKDGLLVLYRGKPVRDNDYKEWCTSDYKNLTFDEFCALKKGIFGNDIQVVHVTDLL